MQDEMSAAEFGKRLLAALLDIESSFSHSESSKRDYCDYCDYCHGMRYAISIVEGAVSGVTDGDTD